ncbi:MAG: hypothetical protein JJ959_07025 [Nisaea sp.]|uniref:VPA1269 family protein n=1 Tax=Nisaea sp. TaxID=2024842 RepID=UPI001B2A6837|nr:VPA1269 family protein [Nisaea sp.]MBO6560272.1 hypothetical protein [Nisaea sp.]
MSKSKPRKPAVNEKSAANSGRTVSGTNARELPLYTTQEHEIFGQVRVNLSLTKISLLPQKMSKWHAFAKSITPYLEAPKHSNPMHYRDYERDYFTQIQNKILSSTSVNEVSQCIDEMLQFSTWTVENGSPSGESQSMRQSSGTRFRQGVNFFLQQARCAGLILFPAGSLKQNLVPWMGRTKQMPILGLHHTLGTAIGCLTDGRVHSRNHRLLLTLFSKFIGFTDFTSASDLSEAFFASFWNWMNGEFRNCFESVKSTGSSRFSRINGLLNKVFEAIFAYQSGIEPNFDAPRYESRIHLRLMSNDLSLLHHSYKWFTDGPDGRPDLKAWTEALSWWVNHQPYKQPQSLVSSTKPFLKYIGSLSLPPLSPSDFTRSHVIRRHDSPERTYLEFLHEEGYAGRQIGYSALNDVRRFFEQWHDEHCAADSGWQCPIKDFDINPAWSSSSGKTNKDVLPVRIIKMMKEIITENDYAWPRTLREDYFDVYDEETKRFKKIWSPARAIGFLTLLVLPIRTIQMRLLDTGEADEEVFDREQGVWLKNTHPLLQTGRQEGFWKRLYDAGSGREFVGVHITSNKTAVVSSAEFEIGYDIPWDCKELIPHIDALIEWQRINNPITRLVTRADFADKTLHPNDAIHQQSGYALLFRDPVLKGTHRDEPVTHTRLRAFLLKCLEEVERRLRAQGEDVVLVYRDKHGSLGSNYTLHGLRAAGITHFVKAGVPIQVIAEFLSGHATILMTLYYTKFGPAYITDALDRAMSAMDDGSEDDYLNFLKDAGADRLSSLVVSNSDAGTNWMADTTPGVWAVGIDGICPTGRAMCEKGGEAMSAHNDPYYAPVSGGPRNCALCRFFITGPAFLNGQVIAFNNHLFAIGEKAKDLNRIKAKVAELEASGKSSRRIERDRNQVDALEKELDLMFQALQARFSLIEKSREMLRNQEASAFDQNGDNATQEKHQFVTRMSSDDDVQMVIEETSEFDLIEFVSQACEIFPEKAEPSAPLRKGKILDQFLKRNGYEALFYQLPDEEALASGNKLTRFLQEKVGRDRLRSLMDGHETLISLGISDEFESHSGSLIARQPLRIDAQQALE